jgi:hypothetical protein
MVPIMKKAVYACKRHELGLEVGEYGVKETYLTKGTSTY